MKNLIFGLLETDLQEVLVRNEKIIRSFSGQEITILGGTGFLGSWLAKSLIYVNRELSLGIRFKIIARNVPTKTFAVDFNKEHNVIFLAKDIQSLTAGDVESTDLCFFAATSSDGTGGEGTWQSSTISGFDNLLLLLSQESVRRTLTLPKLVNLSSGAVYGQRKLSTDQPLLESYGHSFSKDLSDYGKAKVHSETSLNRYISSSDMEGRNLRLFSFFGPGVALNRHFAIGNFILDASLARSVRIFGNPQTKRNYTYPTDGVTAILSTVIQKQYVDINIGSRNTTSLLGLAEIISKRFSVSIENHGNSALPSFYYPDTLRFQEVCSVTYDVSLEKGLERWLDWLDLIE